ncbi:PREDICTED: probable cation-transporting ATPase 13A3 isoform X2 [Priapulus caudatus]|nr:PREDICTED: probable cation-transporting ATPase 13A3 isoform X2 [Priapulus caudatus]XP_014666013.1 PREDICTED: probable cation-transporting ATPase 13A3 isoform X2 [Priapulus caudatus]
MLTWMGIVLTLGMLRLVFHWLPQYYVKASHQQCPLEEAEKILLRDQHFQWFIHDVHIITPPEDPSSRHSADVSLHQMGEVAHKPYLVVPGKQGTFKEVSQIKYFTSKKVKYIWNTASQNFVRLTSFDEDTPCSFFYTCKGLLDEDQEIRQLVYDTNEIKVRLWPIYEIVYREIVNPFYVFQLFSCLLWYFDEYWIYATCIVVMTASSLTFYVYSFRKMQTELRDKVVSHDVITVWRTGEAYVDVETEKLVPGDVIVIPPHGCVMQCDAVLVSGNCIVNESMLTGESVPVTKTPLPNPKGEEVSYSIKQHSRHTLFCGTKIIQTRYYGNEKVKAVVVRTGFSTAKGELVRAIMFPKPIDFKFNRHSYYFVLCLGGCALVGLIYTFIVMSRSGVPVGQMVIRALDIITIAVPPALPAALTIGIVYARERLKKKHIYCLSQNSINICGVINAVCFDKTGTLTEDGLDMWGVAPVENSRFQREVQDASTLPHNDDLQCCMAACHSLTVIDGDIVGDPLDLKMFESTGWELEEPGIDDTVKFDQMMPTVVRPRKPDIVTSSESVEHNTPFEVGIVRQFTFSSSLQRMSVITRKLGAANFQLYVKGSPEMIISLSKPETVPGDFSTHLHAYTRQGYRVIGVACKPLPHLTWVKAQRITRDRVEHDLDFLGLLVMENRLKRESAPVIKILRDVSIRTMMITGDNMLTALSVARDCGMIDKDAEVVLVSATYDSVSFVPEECPQQDENIMEVGEKANKKDGRRQNQYHFATTGPSFAMIRDYHSELLPRLILRGTVYARMNPDQKAQLIEHVQDVGYNVAMCGDGANDCGALKTAHTGISLSEAEASVASPFTSLQQNIKCVPTVIREGRAALVTSFGMFKYMACYSLTQFVSVMILYWLGASLTDLEFLWIDLFLLTVLGVLFGRTGAYPILVKETPPASLMSVTPLLSVFCQMTIITIIQVVSYVFITTQPWFVPFERNDEEEYDSYENHVVFVVSQFQYITLAFVFSKGAPYRNTVLSNRLLCVTFVLLTAACVYITIYPADWLVRIMELKPPPDIKFSALLVLIAVVNFFICVICEMFFVDYLFFRVLRSKVAWLRRKKREYDVIESELLADPSWPPIDRSAKAAVQARSNCLAVETTSLPTETATMTDASPQQTLTDAAPQQTLIDTGVQLADVSLLESATDDDDAPAESPDDGESARFEYSSL